MCINQQTVLDAMGNGDTPFVVVQTLDGQHPVILGRFANKYAAKMFVYDFHLRDDKLPDRDVWRSTMNDVTIKTGIVDMR